MDDVTTIVYDVISDFDIFFLIFNYYSSKCKLQQ